MISSASFSNTAYTKPAQQLTGADDKVFRRCVTAAVWAGCAIALTSSIIKERRCNAEADASFSASHSLPLNPLAMAGFQESHDVFPSTGDAQTYNAILYWEIYKRNRLELNKARADCEQQTVTCQPFIITLNQALAGINKLHSPASKAIAIGAWVNIAITYDHPEAKLNLPRRSLIKTLVDGLGVCDEQAQLKLYMLEETRFNRDDIRYIFETVFQNNKAYSYHAVAQVRIGGLNWILQNTTPTKSNATDIMQEVSELTQDLVSTNRDPRYQRPWDYQYIPIAAFNNDQIAIYPANKNINGPFPQQPKTAVQGPLSLRLSDLNSRDKTAFPTILKSAFAYHYHIEKPAAKSAMPSKAKSHYQKPQRQNARL